MATVMSSRANPVTASEKVAVAAKAAANVVAVVVNATVGPVASYVTLS